MAGIFKVTCKMEVPSSIKGKPPVMYDKVWTNEEFESERKAKLFVRRNLEKGYKSVGFQKDRKDYPIEIAVFNKNTMKWHTYGFRCLHQIIY